MKHIELFRIDKLARDFVWVIAVGGALGLMVGCGGQSAGTAQQPPAAAIVQPTMAPAEVQLPPASTAPASSANQALPTQASVTAAATAPAATAQSSAAAPSCAAPASLTPALTEGPYFKAGSPERASLLTTGMAGTRLVITGYVLSADCKPVANALLDFWQADSNGSYDNSGYTLRGHQFTDASGRFQLTTVVPGLYPGRTEHIHVKVQAPNGPVLTTQLFFPGVAQNNSDGIYNRQLLLNIQSTSDGVQATYNFVVNTK